MKYIFILVLFFIVSNEVISQSLSSCVVSSGGENVVNSNSKIQFTIGETITLESSKTTLGFHSVFSKYLHVVDQQKSFYVKAYPNPVENNLVVEIENLNSGLIIRNINSQVVLSKTLIDYNNVIDLSNFASGMYIIEINGAGHSNSLKFVKK